MSIGKPNGVLNAAYASMSAGKSWTNCSINDMMTEMIHDAIACPYLPPPLLEVNDE
jgi:hypothetical protein